MSATIAFGAACERVRRRTDAPVGRQGEDGFTLLELMVVIVVIAVLIVSTFGAYTGARQRAQERAAQGNARIGFDTESVLWVSTGQLSSDAASALPGEEPNVHWVADAVPANAVKRTVVVSVGTTSSQNDTVVLGVKADDGVCFYMRNTAGSLMQYGKDAGCSSATNTLVSGSSTPPGGLLTTW